GSSIGVGMSAAEAIEGMYRNPDMANKLRSNMIVGIALDETCGIYALLIAILIIFVLGGK
ncbi:MAG: ATP synthase F0 subunit C, partial [Bacilli bacterium]|nr:ATP synthase F0 subunit C [Bacilli bacterium]